MNYLVDTNVLCEPAKPKPNPKVMDWLTDNDSHLLVSVLTLGEILKGIELLPTGKRRRAMQAWFERIEAWAEDRLLPIDQDVMRTWGTYYARHLKRGRTLDVIDSLLGATALTPGLTVATRNGSDFPEVPLVNPWN